MVAMQSKIAAEFQSTVYNNLAEYRLFWYIFRGMPILWVNNRGIIITTCYNWEIKNIQFIQKDSILTLIRWVVANKKHSLHWNAKRQHILFATFITHLIHYKNYIFKLIVC